MCYGGFGDGGGGGGGGNRGSTWGVPSAEYVDTAIRHVLMRQGMLGVKVQIMLPHDPSGKSGPKTLMGDQVIIREPKE